MLRRLALICALAALSIGAMAPSAHAGWSPAGGALNVDASKSAYSPSIATIAGVPYVAWREDVGVGQVHVARWNGSAWSTLGGVLNVDATKNAYLPRVVDVAGTPYVAWTENNGSNVYQVHVKSWTGSTWAAVGGILNVDPTKTGNEPEMASVGGTPYVVWLEPDASSASQVRVKRWNGSTWTSAGASLNTDTTKVGYNPHIADIGGTPYVTWREEVTPSDYQVHVKSWNGLAWANVGGVVNVDPTKIAQASRLASVAGVPYIAWEEYNASSVNQVHVARWTNSAWEQVGGVLDIDPTKHAGEPSVASLDGTPYVVWEDETYGGGQVHVASWTGSAWSLVGDALNPATTRYGQVPRLAFAGNVAYVAWNEPTGSVSQVRVSQLAIDVPGPPAATTDPGATTPSPPAPAPAPAPKPAAPRTTIACTAAKRKVTCSVKLAAARSGAVRVALRRGSVTVATGAGRLSRGGAKLKLSARKRVKPGRYTLIIKAGKATISTTPVRIGR